MKLKIKLKLQTEEGRDWGLPALRWKDYGLSVEKDEIKKEKWKIETKEDLQNGRWETKNKMKIVATGLEHEDERF